MASDVTIRAEARLDTRRAEADLSAFARKAEKININLKGIDSRKFTQPLGKITGSVTEFQKSLDASNARVIAFTASAGILFTVVRAFKEMASATIEVEKTLKDINVILGASSGSLQKFSSALFQVAKDTGQSFYEVGQAATEFARQGLSMEKTIIRTRDALILMRLSGMDATAAVNSLTAAINSFNQSALTSTQIINKMANVDAAFAVSTNDLAEAIRRVGSTADDVNVSFDELLAAVTSVQQTTARGGNVIGNSFKTIFTRIQRTTVIDQMKALGVSVRDTQGQMRPAMKVLSEFAKVYDKLHPTLKASTAELIGGVYQMNILKALLKDLGKEYSIYNGALKTSVDSTNEAMARNAELNKSLKAMLNESLQNLTAFGAGMGKLSFEPIFKKIIGGFNSLSKEVTWFGDIGKLVGIDEKSANDFGGKMARGVMKSIGRFLEGPGLVALVAIAGKLFIDFTRFLSMSVKDMMGLNKAATQQAVIQQQILTVLQQEPKIIELIEKGELSRLSVEQQIIRALQTEIKAREKIAMMAKAMTPMVSTAIGSKVNKSAGTTSLVTKAEGHIPNFAPAGAEFAEMIGAMQAGYKPGDIKQMSIPREGQVLYNDAETVKKFKGIRQPAIIPPGKAGKKYADEFESVWGFDPRDSSSYGFLPNFFTALTSLRLGAHKQGRQGDSGKLRIRGDVLANEVGPELGKIIRYVVPGSEVIKIVTMGQQKPITKKESKGFVTGKGRKAAQKGAQQEAAIAGRKGGFSLEKFRGKGPKAQAMDSSRLKLPYDSGEKAGGRTFPVESKPSFRARYIAQIFKKTLYENNSSTLRHLKRRLKSKADAGDPMAEAHMRTLNKRVGIETRNRENELAEWTQQPGGEPTIGSLREMNAVMGFDTANAVAARKQGIFSGGFLPNFNKLKAKAAGPTRSYYSGGQAVLLPERGENIAKHTFSAPVSKIFGGSAARKGWDTAGVKNIKMHGFKIGRLPQNENEEPSFRNLMDKEMTPAFQRIGQSFSQDPDLTKKKGKFSEYFDRAGWPQVRGRIFEAVLNYIGGSVAAVQASSGKETWDFEKIQNNLADLYDIPVGTNSDAKPGMGGNTPASMIKKALKDKKVMPRYGGFIPNFSTDNPLAKAWAAEKSLGGEPVLGYHPRTGPMVYSKSQGSPAKAIAQHKEGLPQAMQNSRKMQKVFASHGHVPHFAEDSKGTTGFDTGIITAALAMAAFGFMQMKQTVADTIINFKSLQKTMDETVEAEEKSTKELDKETKSRDDLGRSIDKRVEDREGMYEERKALKGKVGEVIRPGEKEMTKKESLRLARKEIAPGGRKLQRGEGTQVRARAEQIQKQHNEAIILDKEEIKKHKRSVGQRIRQNKAAVRTDLKNKAAIEKQIVTSEATARSNTAAREAQDKLALEHNRRAARSKSEMVRGQGGTVVGSDKSFMAGGVGKHGRLAGAANRLGGMAMAGMMAMPAISGAATGVFGEGSGAQGVISGVETAGMGAMMGGMASSMGANPYVAIAIAVGAALLGVFKALDGFLNPMASLQAAAEKAKEELTKFSNASQGYMQAFEAWNSAIEDPFGDPELVLKRRDQMEESFRDLPQHLQDKFGAIKKDAKSIAQFFEDARKDLQGTSRRADAGVAMQGIYEEERGWFVDALRDTYNWIAGEEGDRIFKKTATGRKAKVDVTSMMTREVTTDMIKSQQGARAISHMLSQISKMGPEMDSKELERFVEQMRELNMPSEFIDQMRVWQENREDGRDIAQSIADALKKTKDRLAELKKEEEFKEKQRKAELKHLERMKELQVRMRMVNASVKTYIALERQRIDTLNSLRFGKEDFKMDVSMQIAKAGLDLATPFLGKIEKSFLDTQLKLGKVSVSENKKMRAAVNSAISESFDETSSVFMEASEALQKTIGENVSGPEGRTAMLDIQKNQKIQKSVAPLMVDLLKRMRNQPRSFKFTNTDLNRLQQAIISGGGKNAREHAELIRVSIMKLKDKLTGQLAVIADEAIRQRLLLKNQQKLQEKMIRQQDRLSSFGGTAGYLTEGAFGLSKNIEELRKVFTTMKSAFLMQRSVQLQPLMQEEKQGMVRQGRAAFQMVDKMVNNLNLRDKTGRRLGGEDFGSMVGMAIQGRTQDIKLQVKYLKSLAEDMHGGTLPPELEESFKRADEGAGETALEQVAAQLKISDIAPNVEEINQGIKILNAMIDSSGRQMHENNRKAFQEALQAVSMTGSDEAKRLQAQGRDIVSGLGVDNDEALNRNDHNAAQAVGAQHLHRQQIVKTNLDGFSMLQNVINTSIDLQETATGEKTLRNINKRGGELEKINAGLDATLKELATSKKAEIIYGATWGSKLSEDTAKVYDWIKRKGPAAAEGLKWNEQQKRWVGGQGGKAEVNPAIKNERARQHEMGMINTEIIAKLFPAAVKQIPIEEYRASSSAFALGVKDKKDWKPDKRVAERGWVASINQEKFFAAAKTREFRLAQQQNKEYQLLRRGGAPEGPVKKVQLIDETGLPASMSMALGHGRRAAALDMENKIKTSKNLEQAFHEPTVNPLKLLNIVDTEKLFQEGELGRPDVYPRMKAAQTLEYLLGALMTYRTKAEDRKDLDPEALKYYEDLKRLRAGGVRAGGGVDPFEKLNDLFDKKGQLLDIEGYDTLVKDLAASVEARGFTKNVKIIGNLAEGFRAERHADPKVAAPYKLGARDQRFPYMRGFTPLAQTAVARGDFEKTRKATDLPTERKYLEQLLERTGMSPDQAKKYAAAQKSLTDVIKERNMWVKRLADLEKTDLERRKKLTNQLAPPGPGHPGGAAAAKKAGFITGPTNYKSWTDSRKLSSGLTTLEQRRDEVRRISELDKYLSDQDTARETSLVDKIESLFKSNLLRFQLDEKLPMLMNLGTASDTGIEGALREGGAKFKTGPSGAAGIDIYAESGRVDPSKMKAAEGAVSSWHKNFLLFQKDTLSDLEGMYSGMAEAFLQTEGNPLAKLGLDINNFLDEEGLVDTDKLKKMGYHMERLGDFFKVVGGLSKNEQTIEGRIKRLREIAKMEISMGSLESKRASVIRRHVMEQRETLAGMIDKQNMELLLMEADPTTKRGEIAQKRKKQIQDQLRLMRADLGLQGGSVAQYMGLGESQRGAIRDAATKRAAEANKKRMEELAPGHTTAASFAEMYSDELEMVKSGIGGDYENEIKRTYDAMVKQEKDYAFTLKRITDSFKNFGQLMVDHAGNQMRALEDKLGEARDKVYFNRLDPTMRGTERVENKRQLHTLEVQKYDAIHGENAALRDKSEELIKIWKTFSDERVRDINAQIDALDREINELRMDPTLDATGRGPQREREINRARLDMRKLASDQPGEKGGWGLTWKGTEEMGLLGKVFQTLGIGRVPSGIKKKDEVLPQKAALDKHLMDWAKNNEPIPGMEFGQWGMEGFDAAGITAVLGETGKDKGMNTVFGNLIGAIGRQFRDSLTTAQVDLITNVALAQKGFVDMDTVLESMGVVTRKRISSFRAKGFEIFDELKEGHKLYDTQQNILNEIQLANTFSLRERLRKVNEEVALAERDFSLFMSERAEISERQTQLMTRQFTHDFGEGAFLDRPTGGSLDSQANRLRTEIADLEARAQGGESKVLENKKQELRQAERMAELLQKVHETAQQKLLGTILELERQITFAWAATTGGDQRDLYKMEREAGEKRMEFLRRGGLGAKGEVRGGREATPLREGQGVGAWFIQWLRWMAAKATHGKKSPEAQKLAPWRTSAPLKANPGTLQATRLFREQAALQKHAGLGGRYYRPGRGGDPAEQIVKKFGGPLPLHADPATGRVTNPGLPEGLNVQELIVAAMGGADGHKGTKKDFSAFRTGYLRENIQESFREAFESELFGDEPSVGLEKREQAIRYQARLFAELHGQIYDDAIGGEKAKADKEDYLFNLQQLQRDKLREKLRSLDQEIFDLEADPSLSTRDRRKTGKYDERIRAGIKAARLKRKAEKGEIDPVTGLPFKPLMEPMMGPPKMVPMLMRDPLTKKPMEMMNEKFRAKLLADLGGEDAGAKAKAEAYLRSVKMDPDSFQKAKPESGIILSGEQQDAMKKRKEDISKMKAAEKTLTVKGKVPGVAPTDKELAAFMGITQQELAGIRATVGGVGTIGAVATPITTDVAVPQPIIDPVTGQPKMKEVKPYTLQDTVDEFFDGMKYDWGDMQEDAHDAIMTISKNFQDGTAQAFTEAIKGTKTLKEAFKDMFEGLADFALQEVMKMMTKRFIFDTIGSAFGTGAKGGLASAEGFKHFQKGGMVSGGSGTKDDVPSLLKRGEYVLRQSAVKKYGISYLDLLNSNKYAPRKTLQGYAAGGNVHGRGGRDFGRVVGNSVRYPDGRIVPMSSLEARRRETGLPSYTLTDPDPGWFENPNKKTDYWGYISGPTDHGGLNMHPDDVKKLKRQWEENAFADPQAGLESRLSHSDTYADLSLRNAFIYNSDKFPTAKDSYYDVDPRLSKRALLDDNNPRNKIRKQKIENLYSYYKSRQDELKDWREDVDEARQQRKARMRNTLLLAAAATTLGYLYGTPLWGTDGNFGSRMFGNRGGNNPGGFDDWQGKPRTGKPGQQFVGAGSGSSFYAAAAGGLAHRAAGGTGAGDSIPAMLMSGEFVMNRDAVNKHGISFFSRLNKGINDIPHFAEGGYVNRGKTNISPNSTGGSSLYGGSSDITNNITISVTVDQNGGHATDVLAGGGGSQGNAMTYDQAHGLSEMIKTKVVETIIQQKRQGGLLHSSAAGNRTV